MYDLLVFYLVKFSAVLWWLSFENEALENEDRSTKRPKLENEAPKTRKRSKLENEAPKTRNLCSRPSLYYESENSSYSSLCHICESKNLRFPFLYEKYHNLGSEMWKIKLEKIVGNLLDNRRKLYMNGTVI